MGFLKSIKKFNKLSKNHRFLIIGPDNSGKTTLVHTILSTQSSTAPTFGYRIHTGCYKSRNLTIVDVGGQKIFRKFWNNFFEEIEAIIFVFDVSDVKEDEISTMLKELAIGVPILVLGNKADLCEECDFDIKMNESLKFFKCSAVTKENLENAFDWLIECVEKKYSF